MAPKPLQIIATHDENSLTDEQILALKDLSPDEIRVLKKIAETSRAMQIIIGIISGIAVTVGVLNLDKLKDLIAWAFK